MAGSSNQSFRTQQPPCPFFDGENYDFWCIKMKTQLISNDLWEYVEDGYDDLENVNNLTDAQRELLKAHIKKDARALSMIQQGISDKIFPRIVNETKAKGAWGILFNLYSATTMDASQHTNLFDTQFTPNHHPMDPNLYKAVKDGIVEDLDQYIDLFDTQLTPKNNTILHVTAQFGKLGCVAKILEKKPCLIRRVNSNNENPLHIAIMEKHNKVVKALINRAKELDQELESGGGTLLDILRAVNVEGDTALHLAVRVKDIRSVRLLVKEDQDFQHPPNKAGETPLYLASERQYGDWEYGESMVESILASYKSLAYTGPNGRTALHAAAIFGNSVGIKKLLDQYEELIDKTDTEGWTPLHYAAYRGHEGVVREILKRNKTVGYTRTSEKHYKSTSLHIAAATNKVLAMEEILSHCPDCWEMVNSKGRNILHIAVDREAQSVVKYIIKKDGLDSLMNQKDFEGNTPIHLLASSDIDIYDILGHHKANLYAFNNQNSTPADVAWSIHMDTSSWWHIKGGRIIAKGEAPENVREKEKKRKEFRDKFRAKKAEAMKKTSESLILVATLIATITFAAAFVIPGGYDGNQGPKQGMAVLVREASFKAFVIANTIAVMCSTSSVVYYVFAAFYYFDEDYQEKRFAKGFYLVIIAIVAMTVGFISGTYAMLVHSLGLAIATSIIACISFLIYFLELKKLASWRHWLWFGQDNN